MATYTSNFSSGAGQLIIEVSNQSYSVANNNSVIKVVMKVKKLKAYSSWNNGGATIYISVNGTKIYTNNKFDFRNLAIDSTQTIGEGVATISHKADGTQTCEVVGYFDTSVSFGKATLEKDYTCVNIPRGATIDTAPNFNDEENPTITYSNSAGTAVSELKACISLTGAVDDIAYRDIPISGTSYTFELTEAERDVLRNATTTSNSRKVKFYIRTVIDGTTFWNNKEITLSIVNANPEINIRVFDTREETTKLTGNSGVLVLGQSTAYYDITANPQKGATISLYSINNGGEDTKNTQTGSYTNVKSNEFNYMVQDSRGNKSYGYQSLNFIDYKNVSLTQDVDITLVGETGARVDLTLEGDYYSGSFGSVNNQLLLWYRYKEGSGDYGSWVRISDTYTPTFNNGRYTLSVPIEGLHYEKAYTFESWAEDKLTYEATPAYTAKLIPVFDWSETDFNFNVPVSFQGETMADIIIDQGEKNGWTYRKYQSGIMECWTTVLNTTSFNTTWGSMYQNDNAMPQLTYPIDFVEAPCEIASLVGGTGYSAWIYVDSANKQTNKKTGVYRLCRPSQVTAQSEFKINIHCLGRWR